jgi:cytochrome c-type biogenesis protein CcmE
MSDMIPSGTLERTRKRAYNTSMKAGTKFAIGAVLMVGAVGYLTASGIKQTGQYFLTPSELAQRVSADPSFYDLGMKVGARVVPGTVQRETATQTLRFHMTDGTVSYPVHFRGLPPDTFTDSVEVVVEGRLQKDGIFYATDVLAKCGSRYEAVPKA